MAFYTIPEHLRTPKIKDKKNYFDKTVYFKILYNEKVRITGVFLWIKDPDPEKYRIRKNTGSDRIKIRIRIRNTS